MRDGAGCVPAISNRASQSKRERVLNVEVTATYFWKNAKKMIHASEFPRSRSTYGTFLYSRIHHEKNKNGWVHVGKTKHSPRPRPLSHRGAADQKKKEKKFRTNYTGQAKP